MTYIEFIKSKIKDKKVCVCPAGIGGVHLVKTFCSMGIPVDFLADNNACVLGNMEELGCKKILIKELVSYKNEVVVFLETTKYYDEIKAQLLDMGIENIMRIHNLRFATDDYLEQEGSALGKNIEDVCRLMEDEKSCNVIRNICDSWLMTDIKEDYFESFSGDIKKIYFDEEIVPLDKLNEISFVDCGAYTGDTAMQALSLLSGRIKEMHLFELDSNIFSLLEKNMQHLDSKLKIKCYPYGVSDKEEKVQVSSGNGNSKVCEDKKVTKNGHLVTLDSLLSDKKIDFIKMDIEGAELAALKGAEHIIRQSKPILAICLYHKPQDMFQIPHYIKSLSEDYKLYVRHYSGTMFDTVCYAIP